MPGKEIEIIIKKDGTVVIEGHDFEGSGCHDKIQEYLKRLGEAKSTRKKAEFYKGKVSIGGKNQVAG